MRGKAPVNHSSGRPHGITPAYAGKSLSDTRRGFSKWDHPRVCGEKLLTSGSRPRRLGSPPRMRGKGGGRSVSGLRLRITPAYAGKSRWPCTRASRARDHPRVCGEKYVSYAALRSLVGSPPRMRGKVYPVGAGASRPRGSPPRMRGKGGHEVRQKCFPGITPAYAGKSVSVIWLVSQPQDHPRVCGEKRVRARTRTRIRGSPPRMRGKETSLSARA